MTFVGSPRPGADGLSRARAERTLERREASARPHHPHGQRPGPTAAGGSRLALSTSAGVGVAPRRADGTGSRAASLRLRTRRNSACVDAFGRWRPITSRRRRSRSRSRASWRAFCGPRYNRRRRRPRNGAAKGPSGAMTRIGDGPRRRRMIRARLRGSAARACDKDSVPSRDHRLHVLPTKHCHVCSAAGDRGNHRISA